MADLKAADAELRAALFELQRYLSDQVPPLIFADAMSTLLRYSTDVAIHEVNTWITAQNRQVVNSVPLSDYLFHAVKKIHLLGEFNLVGKEKLKEYLDDMQEKSLEICPAEDRELLKQNFSMLGEIPTSLASPVEVLYRQAGTESRLASHHAEGADAAPSLRRMSMLLERLQVASGPGSIGFVPNREQILSQALTAAAGMARSSAELQGSLDSVRHLGLDGDPAQSFRLLSQSLPTWSIPMSSIPSLDEWPDTAAPDPIIAMKRLVSMAEDPLETARRYRQLVEAAVQWFNEGSLGRAVTMLDIAKRLEEEKAVEPGTADSVRRTGHEGLDHEKLRACSETKDAHSLLKKVLDFFTPLTVEGLLDEVAIEQRRERRRAILALLEVHGEQARTQALAQLSGFAAERKLEGDKVYFVRNLLYVLNRVTPGLKEDVEKEIDLIAGFTTMKYPFLVLKESIAALGATKHERAVRILARRIGEVEAILSKQGTATPMPVVQLKQVLDRLVVALTRCPGPEANRAVIDHGLKGNEQFGDTYARLSNLASRDLTEDPESLERLINAIRAELPKKVFGFSMQKNKPRVSKVIEALGGTPAPEVYELLEEIRNSFKDQEYSKAAETVLTNFGSAKAVSDAQHAAPSLSGDLEVFGLPNLLESLSSSGASGNLAILDRNGKQVATIGFSTGRIVSCHTGLLRGRDAVFALFEEANPGTFAFVTRVTVQSEDGLSYDVQPLIFEAVRRYDELREARLIVPENVPLATTGSKPMPHPDETDAKLIREVWVRASAGEKPVEWKTKVSADSYRIWRLLSHWVETGALRIGA